MPNVASVPKSGIARVARLAARAATDESKKHLSLAREDIAGRGPAGGGGSRAPGRARVIRRTTLLAALLPTLMACAELGTIAYDSAAQAEVQRCNRLESAPERQACLTKARTATRQAEDVRRKP